MNKFGDAAIQAVGLYDGEEVDSPKKAWDMAVASLGLVDKSCPKCAFLGLCETGWVKGIPRSDDYTRSILNKGYAVKAVEKLKSKLSLASETPVSLWRLIERTKAHNSQMDVVLALWKDHIDRGKVIVGRGQQ